MSFAYWIVQSPFGGSCVVARCGSDDRGSAHHQGGRNRMGGFIVRRLGQGAILLALLSVVVFLMVYLAPGDAAEFAVNARANETEIQRFRHDMGLDLPWYRQYAHLAGNWSRLRFGNSIIQKRPVAS